MTDANAANSGDNTDQNADANAGDQTQNQDTNQNTDANKGGDQNKNSDSLLDNVDADGAKPIDFSKGKPDGFPDDMWDAEKNAPKSDLLYSKWQEAENRAKGLRDKLAKGALPGALPKEASAYTFEVDEKYKDYVPEGDPVVDAVKKAAFAAKIPQETFAEFAKAVVPMLREMAEAEAAEADKGPTEEEKAARRTEEYKKIGPNAPQVVRAVEAWGKQLHTEGHLSESEVAVFKSMATTGDQVRVLNKLRARMGGAEIPMDVPHDDLPSDQEIARLNMEANDTNDPAKLRKVEELLNRRREAGRPDRLQV